MIIEYFIKRHSGIDRKYVFDNTQRIWLMNLTRHVTITEQDQLALEGLGVKLVQVEAPKE